jgi:hypothetical protein
MRPSGLRVRASQSHLTLAKPATSVYLNIYNVMGTLVKSIKGGSQQQFTTNVNFNDLIEGVYYCRLLADGTVIASQKMVLIK